MKKNYLAEEVILRRLLEAEEYFFFFLYFLFLEYFLSPSNCRFFLRAFLNLCGEDLLEEAFGLDGFGWEVFSDDSGID